MVKLVFAQTRTNTVQVGDIISNFLDGFNLLIQEMVFKEILHLKINKNNIYVWFSPCSKAVLL